MRVDISTPAAAASGPDAAPALVIYINSATGTTGAVQENGEAMLVRAGDGQQWRYLPEQRLIRVGEATPADAGTARSAAERGRLLRERFTKMSTLEGFLAFPVNEDGSAQALDVAPQREGELDRYDLALPPRPKIDDLAEGDDLCGFRDQAHPADRGIFRDRRRYEV